MRAAFRIGVAALAMGAAVTSAGAGFAAADIRCRASVQPGSVHLGEPARYRGSVVYRRGELTRPRWVPPDSAGSLAWGPIVARLGRGASGIDTLRIETTVQAFALGDVPVPGVVFVDEGVAPPVVRHLPVTTLHVMSVLTAADSNADLRGVRGPLAAPWWERVPWAWVLAGLLVAAAIVWIVRRLRRRGRPVPTPVAVPAADAATIALRRLAELRTRRLPEQDAYGAHALELTAILRRFLESTAVAPRPGQTTTELAAWLPETSLAAGDAEQVTRLLRGWDALKFARGTSNPVLAHQSEAAVEAFVRAHSNSAPPARKEAA